MEALNTYKTEKTLAEQMNERLAEMKMTKAEAALKMNYSRAALSQYLNGKYASDPTELEKKVREFLAATGGVAEGQEPENSVPTGAGTLKKKVDCQHFFRQIFLGYFSDIVQAFDTLRKNVCGDDYTSLHNPIVLSSVLPAYGMFHSIQILFL